MVYAALNDAERAAQGLTPVSDMSASELEAFDASKAELLTLEALISAGGHQAYYTWLRTKALRASQVEAVLRLLEHARKQEGGGSTSAAIVSAPTGWGKSVGIIAAALPLVEAVVPERLRRLRGGEPFRVLILVPSVVIRQQLAQKIDTMFRDAPGRRDGDLLELVLPSQVPNKDAKPYLVRPEGGPALSVAASAAHPAS
jgi:Rad3-related DNA helicase